MSQINVSFVMDVAILSAVATIAVRLLFVRFNRASYLRARKYKPGMVEYRNTLRVTSVPVLGVVLAGLLGMLMRIVFDLRALLQSHDPERYGVLIWGTAGVLLLYCLIAYASSRIFDFPLKLHRGIDRLGKPKRSRLSDWTPPK